ncbi:MAG: hypothetical protein AAGF97_01580, partial [Planctomycetota bacterium]
YAYLQMKLLTYRVHYSSGLDEEAFSALVTEAATTSDPTEALRSAYRMLRGEKHNYYPVDSYLLDLVLWSAAAPAELPAPPASLIITGEALMQRQTELRQQLRQHEVCLVGGEWAEPPLALMSCESVIASLRLGAVAFEQVAGARPQYFARRRFGITPLLAQVLGSLGYEGIVQSTLDGTSCETSAQPRTRWALPDGQTLAALGKAPLAAHDPIALLNAGTAMGSSMELDHLATLTLARWAHESPPDAFLDLLRSSAEASYLGRMVTLSDYFAAECHQVRDEPLRGERMVSRYLQASCDRDEQQPISRWVQLHQAESLLEQAAMMDALQAVVNPQRPSRRTELMEAQRQVVATHATVDEVFARTQALHTTLAHDFGEALAPAGSDAAGFLLVNACGFDRAIHFSCPHPLVRPEAALAWHHDSTGTEGVVRVPSCGYVFLESDPSAARGATGTSGRLGEALVLTNQHLSVHVHPEHGGIRAVYDLRTRGNRVSQRLGQRPAGEVAEIELESIDLSRATSVSATTLARGRLQVAGQPSIGFKQSLTLAAAQHRVEVDLELDALEQPLSGNPWKNYLSSTLALPDEADLFRGLNGQRCAVQADRVESPSYLEWVTSDRKTALLPGGLPFHVRRDRFCDTLLRARGETQRHFRFAISIDAVNPLREACDFEAPLLLIPVDHRPAAASGWLVHVDAVHALITALEVRESPETGNVVGLVVRLLETAGASGRVTLRTFRTVTAARKVRFDGTPLIDCVAHDDGVVVHLRPHEWTEVELHW